MITFQCLEMNAKGFRDNGFVFQSFVKSRSKHVTGKLFRLAIDEMP